MLARESTSLTEAVTVSSTPVACDGDVSSGLGHPRVFLDIPEGGSAVCPYCSREFILAAGASHGRGH
ncbi:zinc-finger domain-containing protein [Magnetospirillum molischianum]|uniref:Zinc finger CHCC-type domain-containing protein n=1 Tax=Magnetospirillum molischianum DSM 120 TaxID=1150626 RepID=H8FNP8_MAGML|nr:zinc-finger domain-containing protein [Magnetospirillum molischianum]CCG39986.1 conserved hypothetical protein [Magnetospirillum molischianum DSM 120]